MRISIVIPNYNGGMTLERAIKSVISQNYDDLQLIIVDSESQDNSHEIIQRYRQFFDVVIIEKDKGQTDAINKGFRKAKGEILCWLNSDDTYEPGAISKAVEFFLDHPDVMMVYGEGNEIDENGAFIQRFPATQKFDLWALIYIWDYILQPTTFFRKKIFDKTAMIDESLKWCMDWDLWIRIGSNFKVAYIDHVFANSRIYSETKTGSGGIKRLKEIVTLMRKYGKRKYPLGHFIYSEDTIETIVRQKVPLIFVFLKGIFYMSRIVLNKILKTYQGVYEDKWLGKKARFMFPIQKNLEGIKFELELPRKFQLLPNILEVKVAGDKNKINKLNNPGKFDLEIPANSLNKYPIEIEMIFSKSFKSRNDNRKLSCLLHDIKLISY